jgi:hypothetical protein
MFHLFSTSEISFIQDRCADGWPIYPHNSWTGKNDQLHCFYDEIKGLKPLDANNTMSLSLDPWGQFSTHPLYQKLS